MIKIGDFANIFNVSIKTIRFYEEKNLLKPAYVDIYTGYRYYDEKNIDEMSKILAYKNLGFSLDEIKDVHDESIIKKIEEYKNRINTLYLQINTLNSLLDTKEGKINMKTFINDEDAIGKWTLIGLARNIEDFNNNQLLDEDIALKELYFMEGGKEYWVISWTKGTIYINDKPYSYQIIDDKMYINLEGLYNEENKIAVYKKENNKHYKEEDIMKLDNTDVSFKEDKRINGLWNCLGFIERKDNFNISNIDHNGIVKTLSFFPNGDGTITFKNGNTNSIFYTEGYIKDMCFKKTMSSYEIKTINNKNYLITEWKSGDYVYGGFISCYYIFEKIKI